MGLIVEFNEETYEEYFKDILTQYPDLLENLRQDFTDYIASNRLRLPSYFGKDSPYMQPEAAANVGLMHIHIAIPPVSFPDKRPQRDRTCPKGDPNRDAALVYVRGLVEDNYYSLIALLHPGAHEQARDKQIMRYLIGVAQRFQENY